MKRTKLYKFKILFMFVIILLQYQNTVAQDDSAKTIVKLHYNNYNNNVQYIILESVLKKGKVLTPVMNKTYQLYLDSGSASNMIASMQTDVNGKAKAFIPTALKTVWDLSPRHTFIVKQADEELITDYIINKAKISLDTSSEDGVRSIKASVMRFENNEWIPAKEVEIKIGIQRLGGILSAGDDETYTTDSSGTVTVDLKKDSLPGDLKGNYTLVARVEDNDEFGNLLVEKTVPWGTVLKTDNSFFNLRTLWTTRFKTPYWLLLMAYSIVIGVWSTMIYLVIQLIKIKKLGT